MVKPFITSFVVGDSWNLRCMFGYELSGNTKITCGANGKFSSVDAVCEKSEHSVYYVILIHVSLKF